MNWFKSSSSCNKDELKMLCMHGEERISYRVSRINQEISANSNVVVEKYKKDELELAKIRVVTVIGLKNELFVLQLLKTFLQSIYHNADMIFMEKECPRNLEIAIGTVIGCKGKVDVEELGPLSRLFQTKFKNEYSLLSNSCDPRVIEKLTPSIPSAVQVEECLKQILASRNIVYNPYGSLPVNPPTPSLPHIPDVPNLPIIGTMPPSQPNMPSSSPFPVAGAPSLPLQQPPMPGAPSLSSQPPSFPGVPSLQQPSQFPGTSPFPPSTTMPAAPPFSGPSAFPPMGNSLSGGNPGGNGNLPPPTGFSPAGGAFKPNGGNSLFPQL